MGKVNGLRLAPGPPLLWRVVGDIERLRVHGVVVRRSRWGLLLLGRVHHLLDLGLLLGQALDVGVQVVQRVVHGVQVS